MKFVASVTISPGELCKLLELWDCLGDERDPFAHVLISPLFASKTTLKIIQNLKESGHSKVYFDSGGYSVQQDKIEYEELYQKLKDCYYTHQWADWYVLPDHVPTSNDSPQEVEHKVRDTITVARLFVAELPDNLRAKVLPVVQGHNISQIRRCFINYLSLGAKYIGFGSFATMGANGDVNRLTNSSINMLKSLGKICNNDVHIHIFGITTPPALYYLHNLGAISFDSIGWNKAANYGNIYFPFMPAKNVSHRGTKQAGITQAEFEMLKKQTGHHCAFCNDFMKLKNDYMYRRLHNLAVLLDMSDYLTSGRIMPELAQAYLPKYLERIFQTQKIRQEENETEIFTLPY